MSDISHTRDLIDIAVAHERHAQDAKWGEQNHDDGTGGPYAKARGIGAKIDCDIATKHGYLTWAHILDEEFWEVMAESDPTKLRTELVQVMAVCKAWIQAIDRRPTPPGETT